MCRIRHGDRQSQLGRDVAQVLVEAGHARNAPIDGLRRSPVRDQRVSPGLDVRNTDGEEPGSLAGPADADKANERHHVLPVGPLGVLAGAPLHPALEDLGDGEVKPVDTVGNLWRGSASQDGRQFGIANGGDLVDHAGCQFIRNQLRFQTLRN